MQEVPADKMLSGASGSLGVALRTAREARDLPVHKAAQNMHVGDDVIEALEHDDYSTLGASIFVRGHLRNYARLLGLSEDEVLVVYERTANKLVPPSLITLRPDGGNAFTRRFALPLFSVAVAAVLVVLAVAWWEYRPAEQPAMLAEHAGTAAPKPLTMAATAAPAASSVHAGESSPGTPPLLQSQVTMEHKVEPTSVAMTRSFVAKPDATVTRVVHAQVTASTGSVLSSLLTRVKFTVSQASWIEVYDAGGKRLYYDLAPAGDSVDVSGSGPLQVFLGNSPGVSIELNGAPFNQAPFVQPDNTARFHLGETDGNGGQTG